MKTCSTCNLEQPLEKFYKDKRYRDGYRGQCRRCIVDKSQEYHSQNRDRRNMLARARNRSRERDAERDWAYRLERTYGITVERYNDLFENQGGACAICRTPATEFLRKLAVDHDHACCPGKESCGRCVRALLCDRCNPMLGYAQDDPARLRAAADYLEAFPAFLSALGSTV